MHLNNSNGYWYVRRNTDEGKETVAKLGQHEEKPPIYRPETHQDKAENILARLPKNSVEAIITDPPYGIGYESGWEGPEAVASEMGAVSNDEDASFVEDVYSGFERVLKQDSHLYVFARWDSYPDQHDLVPDAFDLNTVIVWDKASHGLGDLSTWAPTHEFILHYEYGDPDLNGKRPQNVIREVPPSTTAEDLVHQTQKPRKLIEYLIEKSSDVGDVVFDPFGGAYTTARAAMRTFRRGISCELDPETHRAAEGLVEKQLHKDPEYDIDWTELTNLDVEDVQITKPLVKA